MLYVSHCQHFGEILLQNHIDVRFEDEYILMST